MDILFTYPESLGRAVNCRRHGGQKAPLLRATPGSNQGMAYREQWGPLRLVGHMEGPWIR
jgi:hypothetical protein